MNLLMRLIIITSLFAGSFAMLHAANEPYISYIYPAGGKQGTTFKVTIAGQRLRGLNTVYFTGSGINATIIDFTPAGGKLNRIQEEELQKRLQEIRKLRYEEMRNKNKKPTPVPAIPIVAPVVPVVPPANPPVVAPADTPVVAAPAPVVLPDLPELRNLEQMSIKQLQQVFDKFLDRQKQPKPPMNEIAVIEVAIDADAAIGNREIRLRTQSGGLTNPMIFQVSNLAEISELTEYDTPPETPTPLTVPTVLNGQIMPGQVDKYDVQLKAGQKLIFAAQARNLIPYIADGVPGWIQGILTISAADGRELAFNDDNGFDPDPIIYFNVPQDGNYTIKFRDSIYRGRWDFVYRIYIAEQPAIQALFPTGSRVGMSMTNTPPDWGFAVKPPMTDVQFPDLPRITEAEPNNIIEKAQTIAVPVVINGCINSNNDMDYYKFTGNAGDTVVAAVYARRYGSQLDSILRLTDATGKVVALNDDFENKELGLMTHHTDSYLMAKLPTTGIYYLQISDAQRHGGELFTYSLRVSPPQPDFSLTISPSCVNVLPGRPAIITVSAIRKDGWDGDIEVALKNAPAGFSLGGAIIPKGKDSIRMTLTAPEKKSEQPVSINMEGRATVGDKIITRPLIAADKVMQAFAYIHLVPAQNLEVATAGGRRVPVITLLNKDRLKIPSGGTTKTTITIVPAININMPISIELSEPPAGITLKDASNTAEGIVLTIAANDKCIGTIDNLIAEVFTTIDVPDKKTGTTKKQRVSAGVLPAIPVEVVKQ
jgi:hypothetical protein